MRHLSLIQMPNSRGGRRRLENELTIIKVDHERATQELATVHKELDAAVAAHESCDVKIAELQTRVQTEQNSILCVMHAAFSR